jgi:hypothetical protein
MPADILSVAGFTARNESLTWRNTLKWRSKSACKDSQFLSGRRTRTGRAIEAATNEQRSTIFPPALAAPLR